MKQLWNMLIKSVSAPFRALQLVRKCIRGRLKARLCELKYSHNHADGIANYLSRDEMAAAFLRPLFLFHGCPQMLNEQRHPGRQVFVGGQKGPNTEVLRGDVVEHHLNERSRIELAFDVHQRELREA